MHARRVRGNGRSPTKVATTPTKTGYSDDEFIEESLPGGGDDNSDDNF